MKANLHKIRYKLILLFLVLVVVVISSIVAVTYQNSVAIIRDQSVRLNNKLLDMGTETLKTSVGQIDKIYQALYTNGDFRQYLKDRASQGDSDTARAYASMKTILLSLVSARKDIYSIIYVDRSGYLIYTTQYEAGSVPDIESASLPGAYREVLGSVSGWSEGYKVLPTYKHIPLLFSPSPGGQYVYSLARKIINTENQYEYLGVMFINVNLSTLQTLCRDIVPYEGAFTYVVDGGGAIVYDSQGVRTGERLDASLLSGLGASRGDAVVTLNGQRDIAVYATDDGTGWKIVNFIPEKLYTANVSKVTNIAVIVSVSVILFSVAAILFSSSIITKPIERLSNLMGEIELESMNRRADVKGGDEIAALGRNFNRLLDKLQSAIRREYEMGISQKNAEMKALQAQINPHFLYNVLQSMSSIALLYNVGEINIMAKSLGWMLRYSIKTEDTAVSIGQECRHVENYLAIQKVRYGERLEYHMGIPAEIREMEVLKLTLQPIVENSIVHGFENLTGKGIVYITAELENGAVVFDISDNGRGMAAEELAGLRRSLEGERSGFFTEQSPGLGLRNVMTRLRLRYGASASVWIESEPGVGTSIKISVPALARAGEERP